MAFCNSCGANLVPDSKFCNKCGAPIGPGQPVAPAPPAAAPASGGSALKVVLIVIAVIVALGVAGVASLSWIVYRTAKGAHVTQKGDQVTVDTPLGTFSANNPEQAARDLGVEVYPGAIPQKKGSATANFGGVHTVAANFETTDSVDKVCEFYKTRLPSASVKTSEANHCTIVSTDQKNAITINVDDVGGATRIQIASVNREASKGNELEVK